MSELRGVYIDGRWAAGQTVTTRLDRWTGDAITDISVGGQAEALASVDAADAAFREGLSVPERARVLSRVAGLVEQRREEFAVAIQRDMGKPISMARGEVERAVGTLRYSAEESRRLPGERVPLESTEAGAGTFAMTIPQGRGIVAAITPFNFPINLVAHKVGPALAAGCAVVLKPSDKAPLAALMLVDAFEEAGLPGGWLNVVNGPAEAIVDAWIEDRRVAVIDFTGSAAVGWQLKARSPRKMHILELGSNTAMYVDASADLERATNDAVTAGYSNSGQACISLQRLFVHEDVVAEFTEALESRVRAVVAGDPSVEATVVGPLVTDAAADRVDSWLEAARREGARLVAGSARQGALIAPTLLDSVPEHSPLIDEEVFGPVVSVVPVASTDEAIARINRSDFGLNVSLYSNDLAVAMDFGTRAEAGSVLVNMPPSFRADHMPYGGIKDSGQGTEGVRYAVQELVHNKLVVFKA